MTNSKKIDDILNKLHNKAATTKTDDKINQQLKQVKRASTIGFLKFRGFGMSEIIKDRLYLAGQDVANSLEQLKIYKITHILNLTSNIENLFEPKIKYKRIKMYDTLDQDIVVYLDESFDFIDECLNIPNGRILVHCNAGVSRSASIIIAYLIYKNHFDSYTSAYENVKKCRPIIQPNPNFIQQLKKLGENSSNVIKNL
jgi:protein-tyrosine phosphatase